jgi:hypothetical protein
VKLALTVMLLAGVPLFAYAQDASRNAPRQPIPFNHQLHVTTLKQACKTCHADRDPGEMVGMPDTAQCLQCHSNIEPKDQGEKKLAAFGKTNRQIDWVRIYQIPTFVQFDHRQHSQANVKCEACHGQVETSVALWQEMDVSMGSCMACHRTMQASLDCGSCHSPR